MADRNFSWHQNTVYRIEAGQRRVTLEEAAELATIFAVPLADFGCAA
jgi:hypothetical protein